MGVGEAIEAFRAGRFVIIFDEEREKEGDLALAAEKVTPEAIAFMSKCASGLVCLALPKSRLRELEIEPLPSRYRSSDTPFYVPVDAREVEASGISGRDRAFTVRKLLDPATRPVDLARPGHLILLGAHEGGLKGRRGHTEAVVELARMAGLYPAGLLCEMVSTDGEMKRGEELEAFALMFGIHIVTMGDLLRVAY